MSDMNKKADKTTAIGVLLLFAGGFLVILFGIIALIGRIWFLFSDASSSIPAFLFLLSIIVGGFLIWKGYGSYKMASRYRRICRIMGDDAAIDLSALAQKLGWTRAKLIKALHRQTSHGFWPNSFLDTSSGVFVLGYNPAHLKSDSGNKALDELLGTANTYIHEMATISRSIDDPDLKASVDTLTDIAKQIYTYIGENPEKSSLVRQMSNYFLPTTVNLLADYSELQKQTVKSENMLTSMQKITEMMSRIEPAFRKQLDDLYSKKSMDVSVEIEVMQNMLDI